MKMNRQCGNCKACCEGWLNAEIDGHKMSAGTPCIHCTETGCAIYPTRPVDPCREFNCGWLQEDSPLPEHLKPNNSDVIVLLDRKWKGKKVIVAVPAGKKIPDESLEWLMGYTRKTSIPLIFYERIEENGIFTGKTRRGYGPPSFLRAVKTELIPEDITKL
ncbi:MAG: hypothetical protein ACI9CB_002846 [Rhodothermales bacterium]|jgi:hypothetical protein